MLHQLYCHPRTSQEPLIFWGTNTLSWRPTWSTWETDGLFMTAVSTRSQLHSQQPFGIEGTGTCGIWSLQAAFVNLTVVTVLAPPTPQSSVAGPQTPRREWCQNHAYTNRGFAKIGTTHNVYSLDVSSSMLACIVITTPQEIATTELFIVQPCIHMCMQALII